MSDTELLPCPMCGNTDLWIGYASPHRAVKCECGLEMQDVNCGTDAQAIAAWNKRASITLGQAKKAVEAAGMVCVPGESISNLEKYFHSVNLTYEGSKPALVNDSVFLSAHFQGLAKAAQEQDDG